MNILVFAGTTEGRQLIAALTGLPVSVTVSVATEYGCEAMEGRPGNVSVITGRLNAAQMADHIKYASFSMVIDATHPYATEVTANIKTACREAGIEYHRLLRAPGECATFSVPSVSAAVEEIRDRSGNVLLTTGSKELSPFTIIPGFAERMYLRVLPTVEAIQECERLGFRRSHILAMQGPFSLDLNVALIRQYAISVLVTKESGSAGGFVEKMQAVDATGIQAVVIGRPVETGGKDLPTLLKTINALLGVHS